VYAKVATKKMVNLKKISSLKKNKKILLQSIYFYNINIDLYIHPIYILWPLNIIKISYF
jgi:hypothetical protein